MWSNDTNNRSRGKKYKSSWLHIAKRLGRKDGNSRDIIMPLLTRSSTGLLMESRFCRAGKKEENVEDEMRERVESIELQCLTFFILLPVPMQRFLVCARLRTQWLRFGVHCVKLLIGFHLSILRPKRNSKKLLERNNYANMAYDLDWEQLSIQFEKKYSLMPSVMCSPTFRNNKVHTYIIVWFLSCKTNPENFSNRELEWINLIKKTWLYFIL